MKMERRGGRELEETEGDEDGGKEREGKGGREDEKVIIGWIRTNRNLLPLLSCRITAPSPFLRFLFFLFLLLIPYLWFIFLLCFSFLFGYHHHY